MCHAGGMSTYTPAQVVEETGLSIDTLRYYEKIGLLEPVGRNGAGQRRFTDVHLDQLSIARCLRESGMPVADVARYAEFVRAGDRTIDARMALLEEHDRRVEARLESLRDQQRYIRRKIAYYRTVRPAQAAS
jgi:DNA-binding transcriptional MerR regulator